MTMILLPLCPHCPLMGSACAAEFMHASSLARSELGACRTPRVSFSEDLVALGVDNNIIRSSASHMLTGSVSELFDTITR